MSRAAGDAHASALVLLIVVLASRPQAQSRTLDIYWVDVEGGAATLFVAPSGESMLIDTGFDVGDRDAQRIAAAAKTAGLRRIDHVIISHYHTDHVGGLAALAKLIPLGRFYSPGDKIEPANQQWLDVVRATAGDRRTIVKPGDKVPLSGVEVQIVASDEALIAQPLRGGGPNPLCATAEEKAPAGFENQRMVGTHLRFGTFTFLALIDLDWQKEMELACPVNRLGAITLYQSGPARVVRRRGRTGAPQCHQAAGGRDQQRPAEGVGPDRRERESRDAGGAEGRARTNATATRG